MIRKLLLLLWLPLMAAHAEVSLPSLFSDGMVLQQGLPVPVWGWGPPGTTASVEFAGKKAVGATAANGRWELRLAPLTASGEGRQMTITVGGESLTINDVLVGEVWICSGQSNMNFGVGDLAGMPKNPELRPVAQANAREFHEKRDPLFRLIAVPQVTSPEKPLTQFEGKWLASNVLLTGTGYYFGRELRKELNVPIGLIKCAWSGSRIEPWLPPSAWSRDAKAAQYYAAQMAEYQKAKDVFTNERTKSDEDAALKAWEIAVAKAKAEGSKEPRKPKVASDPALSTTVPSTLYNSMVHPLIPYAIRGAIWYQGESNADHASDAYPTHFRLLIEGWRKEWNQGDFPFYFCQLAQFNKAVETPVSDNGWVTVCDYQRCSLAIKNTGMAVLNDIGDADNIHPRNKIDVGHRLALWALARDYGHNIVPSGPLYRDHTIDGGKVSIRFDYVGSGLMTGHKPPIGPTVAVDEPLNRFQICGADKVWQWAEARIIGKDTVEVSHPAIAAPVSVRYAWAQNAEGANLYNREGLPASLFRTDDW